VTAGTGVTQQGCSRFCAEKPIAFCANVTTVAGVGKAITLDELTRGVVETASYAARHDWDRKPMLYAFARKDALAFLGNDLPVAAQHAPGSALIPIEQDPMPEGEPTEVLAGIHWPDDVEGCALVTEIILLPSVTERQVRQFSAGQPAANPGRQARLTVGVLRDGKYACCLQVRGEADLLVGDKLTEDLAIDDLVALLLGTL
jgi:hypothetical protein